MTGPLDIAPPELRRFADRVDGFAATARGIASADALDDVVGAVAGSKVAAVASALGPRLGRSVTTLGDHLGGLATNTRSATDVIVATDAETADKIGGR